MKAIITEYAGRIVLEIQAKTKQEQKDLARYIERCETGFDVMDYNRMAYPTYSPVRLNGTIMSADGCSRTCLESVSAHETKETVYAKTLELRLNKKKSWWRFWEK